MNIQKTDILLFLIPFVFIMVFQGSRGLWERDEGRYTDVALIMLKNKNFFVPKLNDDILHFSKPPLTYWAIASGIAILGKNEWGARLPNALCFSLTVLIIYLISKRLYTENILSPPIIYATSIFPYFAANFITTDTILTCFETLAVYGFILCFLEDETNKKKLLYLIIMWLGFGLAFLTKGPPGIIPFIAIIVFLFFLNHREKIGKLFNPIGILVFFIFGFTWYILVVIKYKNLFSYFLVDEFFKRIATGHYHRNPQWYKPFIIYLPILVFGILPWTFIFFKKFPIFRYRIWSKKWWEIKINKEPIECFLLLWILIPLVIFFIAKSRLPLYILPLFAPISLFVGNYIQINLSSKKTLVSLIIWSIFLFGIKFAMAKFPYKKDSRLMAHQIKKISPFAPNEVVFIDTVPFWGLSLYLNAEVEELTISKTKAQKSSEEYLIDEIKEGEKNILYITRKKTMPYVISLLKMRFIPYRLIGEYNEYVFFYIHR